MSSMLQFVVASEGTKRGLYRRGSLCITTPRLTQIRYEPSVDFHIFDAVVKGIWTRYGYESKSRCELKQVKAKIIIPKAPVFDRLLKDLSTTKEEEAPQKLDGFEQFITKNHPDLHKGSWQKTPFSVAGGASVDATTTYTVHYESNNTSYEIQPIDRIELPSTPHKSLVDIDQIKDLRKPLHKIRSVFNNVKSKDSVLLLPVSIDKSDNTLYRARIWSIVNSIEWYSILQSSHEQKSIFTKKTGELYKTNVGMLFNLMGLFHPKNVNALPEEVCKQLEKVYWTITGRPDIFTHFLGYSQANRNCTLAFFETIWDYLDSYTFKHFHSMTKETQQSCLKIGKVLGDSVAKH